MAMMIVLGAHKLSLQVTIDNHGPRMYSGHYTTFVNCCKCSLLIWSKITEFEMIDFKSSCTAYVVIYALIT